MLTDPIVILLLASAVSVSFVAGFYFSRRELLLEHEQFGRFYLRESFFAEVKADDVFRVSQQHALDKQKTRILELPESTKTYPAAATVRLACEDYIGVCLSHEGKQDKHKCYLARQHLDEQLSEYERMHKDACAFQKLHDQSPYKIAGI